MIYNDFWTGANGSQADAHVSPMGNKYGANPDYLIQANRLYNSNVAVGEELLTVLEEDGATAVQTPETFDLHVGFFAHSNVGDQGLWFCQQDTDNLYMIRMRDVKVQLYTKVAGSYTLLGEYTVPDGSNAAYSVIVEVRETTLRVLVNGVEQIAAVTNTDHARVGSLTYRSNEGCGTVSGYHIDDVTVTNAASTTVLVSLVGNGTAPAGNYNIVGPGITTGERIADLIDDVGNTTGYSFWVNTAPSSAISTDQVGGPHYGHPEEFWDHYWRSPNGGPFEVEFRGLTAGEEYIIRIPGFNTNARDSFITVEGVTQEYNTAGVTDQPEAPLKFVGVVPGDGIVTMSAVLSSNDGQFYGYMNGIELETYAFTPGVTFEAELETNTGSTTSFTVNLPAGTQADDVAIVNVLWQDGTKNITPPAGWTSLGKINDNNSSGSVESEAFYKVCVASEPNPTFTFDAATGASAITSIWRGADSANPLDVPAQPGTSTAATSITPATLTTVTDNALFITFCNHDDSNDGPPAYDDPEATEFYQDAAASGGSSAGHYKEIAKAGTTTVGTYTIAAIEAINTLSVALRPAPPGPAGPTIVDIDGDNIVEPTQTAIIKLSGDIGTTPGTVELRTSDGNTVVAQTVNRWSNVP